MALSDGDRRRLLHLAREAVRLAATERQHVEVPKEAGELAEPRAVFVTLHKGGDLRGCIGSTVARYPLYRAVTESAYSAATNDPRFSPVTIEELPAIEIEISVLSPFMHIRPSEIIVGTHGLYVSSGLQRGLLLPQVAVEHHLTAERFLEETCRKAGLSRDAWKQDSRIQAFTAEVFGDKPTAPA